MILDWVVIETRLFSYHRTERTRDDLVSSYRPFEAIMIRFEIQKFTYVCASRLFCEVVDYRKLCRGVKEHVIRIGGRMIQRFGADGNEVPLGIDFHFPNVVIRRSARGNQRGEQAEWCEQREALGKTMHMPHCRFFLRSNCNRRPIADMQPIVYVCRQT